jgi:hypothetical protein
MVSIVALLSNEDKKSSSKDMGVRLPICGGVFRAAFSRVSCMQYHTFDSIEEVSDAMVWAYADSSV